MRVYNTASLTAVWRCMGKVECRSIKYIPFHLRLIARFLGYLDPPSVQTIAERSKVINSIIKKINPKVIVEIGSGYSTREDFFQNIQFYQMDLPQIASIKNNVIAFDAVKDELKIDVKEALFIVEGLSMYLDQNSVKKLLIQIKKYKGVLLIDFFNSENSTKQKNHSEKLYKLLFRLLTNKQKPFDFRIKTIKSGENLLKKLGYAKVKHIDYKIKKTLDCLFYAEF